MFRSCVKVLMVKLIEVPIAKWIFCLEKHCRPAGHISSLQQHMKSHSTHVGILKG